MPPAIHKSITVSAEELAPALPRHEVSRFDTGAPAANAAKVAALARCKNSLLFHWIFIFYLF
jgi:hypothetical protein